MYLSTLNASEKKKNDWHVKADRMLKFLKSASEKEMLQWLGECANERTAGKETKYFVKPPGFKKYGKY